MRIIAKKTLIKFTHENASARNSLEAWFKEAEESVWEKPGDIIRDYPTADVITGKRFVFNIKGNHFRLIADIEFRLKIVFIVWIGSHAAYDKINVKEVRYVKDN